MRYGVAGRWNSAASVSKGAAGATVITLGALRVTNRRLTRPKPLLLLAYLAHEGPTDRERLARLFFPDAHDPRDALSTSLGRLGDLVGRGGSGDERVEARVVADSHAFLAAALECDAPVALELYRGAFAQGHDRTLGPELEEWVLATRELLASVARDLHLQVARTSAARDDRCAAWDHAQAAVKLTEAHALEPTGTVRLLHDLANARYLVPDAWWRGLASEPADVLAERGAGQVASVAAAADERAAPPRGYRSAVGASRASAARHN
jgi:hypothetical protein